MNFLNKFAELINAKDTGIPNIGAENLLDSILNVTYFVAGTVAVIMIIISGIMYVISTGDAPKVARAKNILTYSIVGLVVVISAFAITNFVIGSFN